MSEREREREGGREGKKKDIIFNDTRHRAYNKIATSWASHSE